MHEGVIILNQEDQLMFCNSFAKKLFLTYLGGKPTTLEQRLAAQVFHPVKVAVPDEDLNHKF